jgi:hypothetical protein
MNGAEKLTIEILELCSGKHSADAIGACLNIIYTINMHSSSHEFNDTTAQCLRIMADKIDIINKH